MSVKLNFKRGVVDLSIGAGGRAMHRLINQLMRKAFDNEYLDQNEDQAILPDVQEKLAFTTDSFVVSPYFFPGGDIGSLSVYGTVNDLCVCGAKPLYLSVGLILEEGFPLSDLKKIVDSMAEAARFAAVKLVTGDTKVVEKGKGDSIFINTSGIGMIEKHHALLRHQPLKKGDVVIVSGLLGEHGVAVMSKRANLDFITNVKSDAIALNHLVSHLLDRGCRIKTMRDPTRGGIAATLNEWADQYGVSIKLNETALPISDEVNAACELLGLDPLFIANEGKLLMICEESEADKILQALHAHPLGTDARAIATVTDEQQAQVMMKTALGGIRRVDWLSGEQLPRIC